MQKENEDATPQTPYNMVHWLNWFHNIICTLIPMCNHQNKQENQYRCRRKPSHAWLRAQDHNNDVNRHERNERAEVELAPEHRRHDLPAEGEEGVAEVAQGREGLAVPGDVGEPGEQHADEQHLAVHAEPPHGRRHGCGHGGAQGREVDAPQAGLQRRERRGQQPAQRRGRRRRLRGGARGRGQAEAAGERARGER